MLIFENILECLLRLNTLKSKQKKKRGQKGPIQLRENLHICIGSMYRVCLCLMMTKQRSRQWSRGGREVQVCVRCGQLCSRSCVFPPDVEHEYRGNEQQAHHQHWYRTHFDSRRVIRVELPHSTTRCPWCTCPATARRGSFPLLDSRASRGTWRCHRLR